MITNALVIPSCQKVLLPINSGLPLWYPVVKGYSSRSVSVFLCDIQACIESLVGWMYSNKLKLNAEKTEVLPVASTSRLSSVSRDSADIGGKRIPFKSSVRNLGVHFDQTLSMRTTHQQYVPYTIPRTQKNSFNPTILDPECNCTTCFLCNNIPAWPLQFHPCRITTEVDFTPTESKDNAAKLVLWESKI